MPAPPAAGCGSRDVYGLQTDCVSAYMRTPGCTSVSLRDWYKDGVHLARCTLWTGSSEATTTWRYVDAEGRYWWVCHLDSRGDIRSDCKLHIDTDTFHRDQHRPGVPGPRTK